MADGFFDFDNYSLCKYIGQTVTIFTASGGATGCGFTGVLMSANECFVRLLTSVGIAPDCPIGSTCCCPCDPSCSKTIPGFGGFRGGQGACGCGFGSVVVIPVDQIVSFCHNAI